MTMEQELHEILGRASETATPPQPESPREYGVAGASPGIADEMITRITAVGEAAIEEHYRQAARAQAMADEVKRGADKFAESMRAFTKAQITYLENHLTFCQSAADQAAKHCEDFEKKLRDNYPRTNGKG